MNNLTFLALTDKYQFKYLFKYPFRYIIQLWSGAKKDHCATILHDITAEVKFAGVLRSDGFDEWLSTLDPQTRVSSYELLNKLTDEQIKLACEYIEKIYWRFKAGAIKYSIIEPFLFKFPILKKIRFAEDKYMTCSKFYLRILQVIDLLPADVYCAAYSVDDIPDLLDRYNLIGGRKNIR